MSDLRGWLVVGSAGAAVVLAVVAGAVVLAGGEDDDEDDEVVTDDVSRDATTAVVAVTYGDASIVEEPADLRLTFLDADGNVLAERNWSEAAESAAGAPGEAVVMGGLVQEVPPGQLRLTATLVEGDEPVSCTQPFTARAGDRLILRLQVGTEPGPAADPVCAEVQTVEAWVEGATTPTGSAYLGLTEEEATALAEADGLTTRVVAVDGMHLAVTMDLRPDRLDLMLFDGIVVAASLPADEAGG